MDIIVILVIVLLILFFTYKNVVDVNDPKNNSFKKIRRFAVKNSFKNFKTPIPHVVTRFCNF